LNIKKIGILIGLGLGCIAIAICAKLFPRPPRDAAKLIGPILHDRIRADDAHYAPGSPNWDLEDRLDRLANDQSPAADAASVILLDYYLGEHNGEMQICAVTKRGARVLPLVTKYRKRRSGVLSLWYLTLRLNQEERNFMYDTITEAIRKNQVLGCD
jgi:hypothetical protein